MLSRATNRYRAAHVQMKRHSFFARVEPRQAFLREYVSCGPKSRCIIKCTDMEMRFSGQPRIFAG